MSVILCYLLVPHLTFRKRRDLRERLLCPATFSSEVDQRILDDEMRLFPIAYAGSLDVLDR